MADLFFLDTIIHLVLMWHIMYLPLCRFTVSLHVLRWILRRDLAIHWESGQNCEYSSSLQDVRSLCLYAFQLKTIHRFWCMLFIRVCLYVYVYTCMFIRVCLYVYVYTCMFIRVCLYVYVYTCMSIRVCLYVYVYTCMSIRVCLYVYVYTCIFIRVCLYIDRPQEPLALITDNERISHKANIFITVAHLGNKTIRPWCMFACFVTNKYMLPLHWRSI